MLIQPTLTDEILEPLHLTFDYPPSSNRYWTLARGRLIVSAKAKAYKRSIANTYFGRDLFEDLLSIQITVYRPQKRGDLDNTLKVLLDAMNGVIWKDDSQIVEIHLIRHEDKHHPRAEVIVTSGYLSNQPRQSLDQTTHFGVK